MIQQNSFDIAFLEYFLAHVRLDAIIELGTGSGWSSMLFMEYGRDVYTFDIIDRREPEAKKAKFYQLDVLSDEVKNFIQAVMGCYDSSMLFCDNGSKPLEFKAYAPLIPLNAYILVHDYPNEITDADIAPVCRENSLVPVFQFESKNSRIRSFQKKILTKTEKSLYL